MESYHADQFDGELRTMSNIITKLIDTHYAEVGTTPTLLHIPKDGQHAAAAAMYAHSISLKFTLSKAARSLKIE